MPDEQKPEDTDKYYFGGFGDADSGAGDSARHPYRRVVAIALIILGFAAIFYGATHTLENAGPGEAVVWGMASPRGHAGGECTDVITYLVGGKPYTISYTYFQAPEITSRFGRMTPGISCTDGGQDVAYDTNEPVHGRVLTKHDNIFGWPLFAAGVLLLFIVGFRAVRAELRR